MTSLSTELHRRNENDVGTLVWLVGEQPDQRATSVGELLGHLLRQLGVQDADQGATDVERAGTCRRVLTEITRTRPVMVVVDNYRQFEQIQPLVELELPNLIIVVTTTERQRELGARSFRFYEPELLSDSEARELFVSVLEETAAEIDDVTIDRLVAHCGGIPLVVRLLAARLVDQAELAAPLLEEIRHSKLSLLSLDSERRIQQSLDLSYASLEPELKRLYRRLAALPGADFGVDVAAAALRWAGPSLPLALAELVKRNLLVKHKAISRYGFHPLVYDHARGCLLADETGEDDRPAGAGVVRGAVDWYLREALPRARSMSGRWWVDTVTDLLSALYGGSPPTFDRDEADAWFDAELANIVAVVRAAERLGMWREAWALCVGLWNHVHVHQRYDAWIDTHIDGLRAARAAGDREGVLQVASQLGAAHLAIGDTRAARRYFEESLAAGRELGHALGEQSALEWLGKVMAREGSHLEALRYYAESWQVNADRVTDRDQQKRAFATLRLQRARSLLALARWPEVLDETEEAADVFDRRPNEVDNSAKCRLAQGRALLGAGEVAAALPVLRRMLDLFEQAAAERSMARGRVVLASAHRTAGQNDEAIEQYRLALAYFDRVGDRAADEVRESLEELGSR